MAVSIFEAQITLPESAHGERMDKTLAALLEGRTRSTVQQWIEKGYITHQGTPVIGKQKVLGGETIEILAELAPSLSDLPQSMALEILYEDDSVLVLNKPAGLVVHPGSGIESGTLLNGLLHHIPSLQDLPRAGIVHRLDKDTSGVMVIAKTALAHQSLIQQFSEHGIEKQYQAIVKGPMIAGGTLETDIDRSPHHRTKMSVAPKGYGKPAVTHYRVATRFEHYTHLKIQIETGRTHQIRVHMLHIHHPIVGDTVYGGRLNFTTGVSEQVRNAIRATSRQMLHASHLGFDHPETGERLVFDVPLPQDFLDLLALLKTHDPLKA